MSNYSCINNIAWILGLLPGFAVARGAQISLDFKTLPSSQGWIYSNSGQPALESAVFSVAGGALQQNTIGIGGEVR